MESTGSYWKPLLNVLESDIAIVLANARHVKNVPGRKSDVIDCQWLAQLLRHGLIRGSFIPSRDIRNLRDLTRRRRQLIGAATSEKNRIQKLLEDANLKLRLGSQRCLWSVRPGYAVGINPGKHGSGEGG